MESHGQPSQAVLRQLQQLSRVQQGKNNLERDAQSMLSSELVVQHRARARKRNRNRNGNSSAGKLRLCKSEKEKKKKNAFSSCAPVGLAISLGYCEIGSAGSNPVSKLITLSPRLLGTQ